MPGDGVLERQRRLGRQVMADEPPAVPVERGDHGVDVLRRGQQEQRRGLLRHLGAELVQERVVQVRRALGLAQSARGGAGDEADREARQARTAMPTRAPVRAPSAVRLPMTSPRSSTST